jgi:UPF0755 protein
VTARRREAPGRFRSRPLAVVAACALLAAGWVLSVRTSWDRPAAPFGAQAPEVVLEVPAGATLRATARQLAAAGVVASARRFEWLGRATGLAGRVQPGEYALSAALTPRQVLDRLVRGEVVLHPVTLPEGLTVKESLERFAAAGFGTVAAYEALLADPAVQAEYGVETAGVKVPFEGYLFPDTYRFAKGTPPDQVLAAVMRRLDAAFGPDRRRRMAALGWTRHQVLTMASLIEKETGRPEERPRVSAVFHNRLELAMRLQSDPTVIYAMPDFDGDIRAADLRRDDPYNTYRHGGLPPGPIANPGDAAIEAALYPSDDPALYFVARGDGTHVFSDTVEAHNRAVHHRGP